MKAVLRKNPVKISAKNQINIELLKKEILTILDTYKFHLKIPNTNEGMSLLSSIHDKTRITEEIFQPNFIELKFETNERLGRYLFNIIKKNKLEIEIVNKEALEEKLKKKNGEPEEDTYTVMKTNSGEEFIIFDMMEEETKDVQEFDESSEEFGTFTKLDEKKKE